MRRPYTFALMWLGGLCLLLAGVGCVTFGDDGADDNDPTSVLSVLDGNSVPIIVVGAEAGREPRVMIYDARDRTPIAEFLAFDETFRGGVRVAVADVNGDGTPDIICGAGPGGRPQVRVVDGRTLQTLAGPLGNFFGIPSNEFTGGVFVAAGDINGDGCADIVVGADRGGGPEVAVWDGKTGRMLKRFHAFSMPDFTGGVRVAVADMDGDGKADIICAAGAGGGPQVAVYSGATGEVLRNFYAFSEDFNGGVYVAAGDLTGEGRAQIITGAGAGSLPKVNVFRGDGTLLQSFFASNPTVNEAQTRDTMQHCYFASDPTDNVVEEYENDDHAGVRVGTTTINGKAILLTGPGSGVPSIVDVYNGWPLTLRQRFYGFDASFHRGVFLGGS